MGTLCSAGYSREREGCTSDILNALGEFAAAVAATGWLAVGNGLAKLNVPAATCVPADGADKPEGMDLPCWKLGLAAVTGAMGECRLCGKVPRVD